MLCKFISYYTSTLVLLLSLIFLFSSSPIVMDVRTATQKSVCSEAFRLLKLFFSYQGILIFNHRVLMRVPCMCYYYLFFIDICIILFSEAFHLINVLFLLT